MTGQEHRGTITARHLNLSPPTLNPQGPKDGLRTPRGSVLTLIAPIEELKVQGRTFKRLSRDRLSQLKKVASIESIGSSTRVEGSKLTDQQIATLLSGLNIQEFKSRDEQEVAGYAAAMDTAFESFEHIPLTDNHFKSNRSEWGQALRWVRRRWGC